MNGFWKVNLVVSVSLFFVLPALAQNNRQIERELIAALKDIQNFSAYGSNYDEEKLSKATEVFEGKLLKHTKTAATLPFKFAELSKSLFIASSDDGKFRIFSWDTEQGGTMHDYSRVYQYQDADGKVYSKADEKLTAEDGGVGSFVYDIFTSDTADGGKIYIVCSTFIDSTNDHYQSANLYKIESGLLKDKIKLIKTKSGLTDSLGFEYNFFSVVERDERPIKLISFNRKTRTLRIPVVIEDKEFPNGRVTNKFISYKFDGAYFVKAN